MTQPENPNPQAPNPAAGKTQVFQSPAQPAVPQSDLELRTLLQDIWKQSLSPQKIKEGFENEDGAAASAIDIGTQATMMGGTSRPILGKAATGTQATIVGGSSRPQGFRRPGEPGTQATIMGGTSRPRGPSPSGTHATIVAGSHRPKVFSSTRAEMTIVPQETKAVSASLTRMKVLRKLVVDLGNVREKDSAEYERLRVLGEGGMGIVFVARQLSIDREVALKMIKGSAAQQQEVRQVFLAEAAVTGELEHPNIVPIHDLGVQDDGSLFYAMKHVKGVSWKDTLTKNTQDENIEVLMKVADAVAFAHSKKIIHRDLKPENVMIGEYGEVMVMDWGLAASVEEGGKAPTLTNETAAGGTPAYMAPEMALGRADKIGVRSDVYLLGAILYEIVTGLRPHTGKDMMAVLYNIATNVIQPTEKAGELVDIARKAMATEPENRYASVKELQAAVRECQKHYESIRLSDKAHESLERAERTHDYEDYAQALFGYQQALNLWDANKAASKGADETRIEYAKRAIEKSDIDLAQSLIEPVKDQHVDFSEQIHSLQLDREARRKRLKVLTWGSAIFGVIFITVLSIGFVVVRSQREKAIAAERDARAAQENEIKQKQAALDSQKRAEEEKNKAEAAEKEANVQRNQAEEAKKKAQSAEVQAKEALDKFQEAVKQVAAALGDKDAAEKLMRLAVEGQQKAEAASRKNEIMLKEAKAWIFGPTEAAERQKKAATESGQPVIRSVSVGAEKMNMAFIPPGTFIMGSLPEEPSRTSEEVLHRVSITKPYYMATVELSVAQWMAITGESVKAGRGGVLTALQPVANVTAREVFEKLLVKAQKYAPEGYEFRLPTEAEWEWACRAGTNYSYNNGPSVSDLEQVAWFRTTAMGSSRPVEDGRANPWGLKNMHGNVSELCSDFYDEKYYQSELTPEKDPENNKPGGKFRVARGGSFVNLAQHCRTAYRSYVHPENRYEFLGVRMVLSKK